jgi:hypothetical protein
MLKAIINGQSSLKDELIKRIEAVDKKVEDVRGIVIKNGERLDKLGLDLAKLQDDAPTIQEFDELETQVEKLEEQASTI